MGLHFLSWLVNRAVSDLIHLSLRVSSNRIARVKLDIHCFDRNWLVEFLDFS